MDNRASISEADWGEIRAMAVLDLSMLEWVLRGWRPYSWKVGGALDTFAGAEMGPVRARVPGSVQQALLDAGVIPDWRVGLNSRACEWIEHRHWQFTAEIPSLAMAADESVFLDADGLDYSGWVYVDNHEAGRFEGALIPHRIDLSPWLSDGRPHRLHVVFEEPPAEQGQFGYTSQSRYFKPRYGYSWDWCPRIVPIGIWDALKLSTSFDAALEVASLWATLQSDNATGDLEAIVGFSGTGATGFGLIATLKEGDTRLAETAVELKAGANTLRLGGVPVRPWWPNGHGDQHLYALELRAEDAVGKVVWHVERSIGFKRVEWQPCQNAPADAEPWLCVVNGQRVFLQGANWVPPRDVYADSTDEDYRRLIELYREMGCTVLRVWGGGILEKEAFYDLCDRAGILVWQEFPLSSSGVENCPPDDEPAINALEIIAASYIQRRAHHVSLLLWCGGNELTQETLDAAAGTAPIDYAHPCIAALREVVRERDPDRRFIATSPSGPRFCADAKEYGQGLHHDVHGPWGMGSLPDLEAWRAYWAGDDSVFRSEVGMPGAMDLDLIRKYAGAMEAWPPDTEYWQHTAAWWGQWNRYKEPLSGLPVGEALAQYVAMTQRDQAAAYEIAATACKGRFPHCGGFIIWMGHDCFPCPANNSVIDFERRPKPAYYALQRIFKGQRA